MNKQLLKQVMSIQTTSGNSTDMETFAADYLAGIGCRVKIDDSGNIYATKGNAEKYPCIVAHVDTVHSFVKEFTILETRGKMFAMCTDKMEQTGIGGDDKCGVYIALKLAAELNSIKVALFVDEEIGCLGSSDADMAFFSDCRFVLQADRRGESDFITKGAGTTLCSHAFKRAVKPYAKAFGFNFTEGSITDVVQLKENGLKISCANIAAGYFNPHTSREYISIKAVENTAAFIGHLFEHLTDVYPHTYEFTGGNYSNYLTGKYYRDAFGYGNNYPTPHKHSPVTFCDWCQQSAKVTYSKLAGGYLCETCRDSWNM